MLILIVFLELRRLEELFEQTAQAEKRAAEAMKNIEQELIKKETVLTKICSKIKPAVVYMKHFVE